nr:MAG TPA: hypothetical protein [Caudoviricetes sp.]
MPKYEKKLPICFLFRETSVNICENFDIQICS